MNIKNKHQLSLTPLIFLLIFLLFSISSCKPKVEENKTIATTKNINRVWVLTEFLDFEKQVLIKAKAELNLSNPKQAVAYMGCNGISAEYNLKNESGITFTEGMRTEMACGDMNLEDDFLEFLPTIENYKIDVCNLTLINAKNEKMLFIAQDWDCKKSIK